MPDYGTTTPTAGWYTDPANATLERWWGGVEWTHDTRPIPVAAAPAAPVAAGIPGGGINPFAGEVQAAPSRLATYDPASAFTLAPTRGFGSASTQPNVAQSWYSEPSRGRGPPPTNGVATAGLILSIVGISAIGIICSAIGLSKAREFDRRGQRPVGRKRSRWGLGLGIAAIVINIALTALYFAYYPTIMAWATNYAIEQSGLVGPDLIDGSGNLDGEQNAVAASYDPVEFETQIGAGYFSTSGVQPDSVECPDTILGTAGSSFTCALTAGDHFSEFMWVFTDDEGAADIYLNGVLVEQ